MPSARDACSPSVNAIPEESSDLPVTRALAGTSTPRPSSASASTRSRSMKIVDENYLPVVVGVTVIGDRVLRLLFSDGTAGMALQGCRLFC